MKKFQGVEQKSLEFQGVHQKLRNIVDFKRGFPWGSMQKKGKSQGVTVNLTGNPGGELQENRYPQQMGGTIVSRKSRLKTFLRRLRDIHGVRETLSLIHI